MGKVEVIAGLGVIQKHARIAGYRGLAKDRREGSDNPVGHRQQVGIAQHYILGRDPDAVAVQCGNFLDQRHIVAGPGLHNDAEVKFLAEAAQGRDRVDEVVIA
ncbi:hypothetical protein D3C72_1627790 [compost metagenome]